MSGPQTSGPQSGPASVDEAGSIDERDDGPRDRKGGPERLCVATREVRPLDAMIRFVLDPAGEVTPDLKRRLPGRGVWITATHQAVEAAVKRNAFSRGFRKPVTAARDLADRVGALLEQAVLDALGVANKARLLATGFVKAEEALGSGRAVALVGAEEAAPDGRRKLMSAARAGAQDGETPPILTLAGPQLDLALGRSNVIHAALLGGPAAKTVLERYRRFDDYRGAERVKRADRID